jgi:hypothetical protein
MTPVAKLLMEYIKLMNAVIENKGGADLLTKEYIGLMKKFDALKVRYIRFIQNYNKNNKEMCVQSCTRLQKFKIFNLFTTCRMDNFVRDFNDCKSLFITQFKDKIEALLVEKAASQLGGSRRRIRYDKCSLSELKQVARERQIQGRSKLTTKSEFIDAIRSAKSRRTIKR